MKSLRIEEVGFTIGSLTANAGGLLDVYTSYSINGTIQSVSVGSNTYTNTGSLLLFESGTNNGINNQGLILQLRAGSKIQDFYLVKSAYDFTGIQTVAGSTAYVQNVVNSPLRLVGSALGNGTSGLIFTIKYI